ncbi:MAG: AMP-binding protein [Pseudonocardia sp.]|nr:AMP-binding protein [Pseudonocardia sp.]
MTYRRSRVPWVEDLGVHGDRLAVVTSDGAEVTYRDLDARVSEAQAELGSGRRLVLVGATNDVEPLVAYLAALRGGHPVLLADGADRGRLDALVDAYDPDVVFARVTGSWRLEQRRPGSAHTLHPELALLLSTSGSTGSAKLVRLSAASVTANAAAIGDYLDIRDTDRAAVSVPMHYCYGLSVVNSNLMRGAALLLSDRSVTDPQFWATFAAHGGTSLHGVPYTFELLDHVGFAEMTLPHLRYVTQAGGRLAPQTVRRYAELGARQDWWFFVMYGQTEATARMAYLPPELAACTPSAVGVPIAGGSFRIETGTDHAGGEPGVGELVYRGPNVMLGYAEGPADLACGRTVEALHTGDLARQRPDGLYEVVGRRSRFIKPFGLRIDLEGVERLLAGEGCTAVATGSDDGLVVVVLHGVDPDQVRPVLEARLGLPPGCVRVVGVEEFPRRSNGKIDHAALARAHPARAARGVPARHGSVRDTFRRVFPLQDLPDDATFVSLGGDSLSYVRMTMELQLVLGHLPDGWDTIPIGLFPQSRRRPRAWPRMETGVVLRAIAIVLVVGSHVGLAQVLGGAHLLFAVAGWTFARFLLAPQCAGTPSRAILRSAVRIAVPTVLWIAWRSAVQDDIDLTNALLVNYVVDPAAWGYWFVEALFQTLMLLAVLLAIPAVRRLERTHPYRFAMVVLVVALVGRAFPDPGNEFSDRLMSTHLVLWLFVLGWLVQRAATAGQRVVAAGLIIVLVPGFFEDPVRPAVVTGGLLLLLLAPRIPVPRAAVRPIGAIATASLAIYLTHYAVYPNLVDHLPPLLVVAACVVFGIAAWAAVTEGTRRGQMFLALRSARRAGVIGLPRGAAVPHT